jgi:ergothioneine biosynthesis protein EgtB
MPPGTDSARWLDTPLIRQAGPDMLSLALMDARNHTLRVFSAMEAGLPAQAGAAPELARWPVWLLGHIAWFQERWIARNLQRQLGPRCDPTATRLAPDRDQADAWWAQEPVPPWPSGLPEADECRDVLLQTLEGTLDLLERADASDDGLYFFRLAVLYEDLQAERLLERAQWLGLGLDKPLLDAFAVPAVAQREPLWLPACRWLLGSAGPGLAFDHELPAHPVQVPEFEIDAQAVSWAQFVEFVDDGGYDRQELWSPQGWDWLQALNAAEGRRGPRYVEQIGVASGAVMQLRFGRPTRMSPLQPAMHVTWWEAQAWCRWAGRRLPLEVEWEIAAETAGRRGLRWGDVWEWTASSFQPYPGFVPGPDAAAFGQFVGRAKVLRGGSALSRSRMKSTRLRRPAEPADDTLFCGFRSCAL